MLNAFLNKKIQRCDEKEAAFTSLSTIENLRKLKPKRMNTIRCYGPEYEGIAEVSSKKTPASPLGKGAPNAKLSLHGYTFNWTEEALWRCDRKSCSILIHPHSDINDVQTVLKSLRPIETNVLSRGCVTRETINFHIGTPQWDPINKNVAASSDYIEKRVSLFTTDNNSHIFGARLQEAAKIPLTKIILHEIGHLLEPLLNDSIRELTHSFYEIPTSISKTLQEISPHYLGKNAEGIIENIRMLNRAKFEKKKTISVNGKTKNTDTYRRSWGDWIVQETFAEMLSHYYLEPCLTRKLPPEPKSGWKALDDFAHRLLREAKLNFKKDSIDKPLFPEHRKQTRHSFIEKIQDFMEP